MDKINFKKPSFWLATWLGSGLMKPAPGTWGSAAAIPFGLIIFKLTGLLGLLIATAIIFRIGIWAANEFDRLNQSHDNKMIVIDEVAGQWLTLIPAIGLFGFHPLPVLAAFLLFRLFDILKPWPVSYLDKKVEGGLGVMVDDIAAGIYASLVLTGLYYAGLG
jgi:phosphatidylglycerophosphatase A